ncbi:hypothetical protein Pmani_019167 [Petrolisthes manimaculis]|uniref:Uncharacterized protein n=1 Tax=Petrolisthes manimaculis TaxID=1843537 RepID=A0AAE1U474_9EUCA|nr:hypothetical protein Pmani_019167 [Petrolisthes manimaculis]
MESCSFLTGDSDVSIPHFANTGGRSGWDNWRCWLAWGDGEGGGVDMDKHARNTSDGLEGNATHRFSREPSRQSPRATALESQVTLAHFRLTVGSLLIRPMTPAHS